MYSTTIEIPNIKALIIEFNFDVWPCIKNDTVIGIIGNTQGVRIAANPNTKAKRKNPNIDLLSSAGLPAFSDSIFELSKSTCGVNASCVPDLACFTPLTFTLKSGLK